MLRAVILTQYQRVTDGQTDRRMDGRTDGIAVASTSLAKQHAVRTAIFGTSETRDLDLDLGSGHMTYHCASVIDLYLHAKFP